jgi:hypothetical protein
MEIDVSQLQGLPFTYVFLFVCLAASVIGGLAILAYVGIRAGLDAWKERRIERLTRKAWLAEREGKHRESR